jgi:hypothetical protein
MELVCVASPLSTQHYGERAKTGWLGIMIMCPSGETCLSADCCFSGLLFTVLVDHYGARTAVQG